MKKGAIITFTTALALLGLLYFLPSDIVTASVSDNLSGWAWSGTAGWFSFNSTNQGSGASYGANVNSDSTLSGYAWSDQVGWISFDNITGCPSSPCQPIVNFSNGQVSGWAKALTADRPQSGGWDGWIHLRGTAADNSSYGVSVNGCNWSGYAWGSEVVGWAHFRNGSLPYGVSGGDVACVTLPQCSDEADNDGDGFIDADDVSCLSENDESYLPQDDDERNTLSQPCVTDSQCISGLICSGGICAYPLDFGLDKSDDISVNVTGSGNSISNASKITVTPFSGFSSTVTLSVQSTVPNLSGASYSLSPTSLNQSQYSSGSTFQVTVPGSTIPGSYTIAIQGAGGGLIRTVDVILHVNSVSPAFREI